MTDCKSCKKALIALLFQPSTGTIYSFLKLQLMKTGQRQSPEFRCEWLHCNARPCDCSLAQRCTALRSYGSDHSKFRVIIVPLKA